MWNRTIDQETLSKKDLVRTPIQLLKTKHHGINIYVKRDDLLPFSFGGNKVRIANEFILDMINKGKNCMIGYGNVRSNMTRALANMCCSMGIPCHIVVSDDEDVACIETNNSRLTAFSNAIVHHCSKLHVAETLQRVIDDCKRIGLKPYYIYGDSKGKGNKETPIKAYIKAYQEITEQLNEHGVKVNQIYCATGTGMTQAGLIAGNIEYSGEEKIIGISIAREGSIISSALSEYLQAYFHDDVDHSERIHVSDEYLLGGYAKFDENITCTIRKILQSDGFALDPVYTGKAFYGMLKEIELNQFNEGNVLFMHSGSAPLFFDYIHTL